MSEHDEELGKPEPNKNESRRLVITGLAVTSILSAALAVCIYCDSSSRKTLAGKPESGPVKIPEYFSEYADLVRDADRQVSDNAWQMRPGKQVSLQDLHGFFAMPLRKNVARKQIRVPGDPRDYRKGVHQGIDFYETKNGDPVYAAAPGIIIRIDRNYVPLTKAKRDELLKLCETKWNGTPGSVLTPKAEEPYGNVLDKLSGRQVVIYHGHNEGKEPIISFYAHLSRVNDKIRLNDVVTDDSIIGYVGNSGTSGEVCGNMQQENHLHMELFVGGMYWSPKAASEIGKRQSPERYSVLQSAVLKELTGHSLPLTQ